MDESQIRSVKREMADWKDCLMWHSRRGKITGTESQGLEMEGGIEKTLEGDRELVCILVGALVTWLDVFVKTHETVNLRVNFTVCKSKEWKTKTRVKNIPCITLALIIPVLSIFLLFCFCKDVLKITLKTVTEELWCAKGYDHDIVPSQLKREMIKF